MDQKLEYRFETDLKSTLFGELDEFHNRDGFLCGTLQLKKSSLKDLDAAQYLSSVESYFSKELISSQNFMEIKKFSSSGAIGKGLCANPKTSK